MPECQKIKNGGLDQYDIERFGRLVLPQSEKCGSERVKLIISGVISNGATFHLAVHCFLIHSDGVFALI